MLTLIPITIVIISSAVLTALDPDKDQKHYRPIYTLGDHPETIKFIRWLAYIEIVSFGMVLTVALGYSNSTLFETVAFTSHILLRIWHMITMMSTYRWTSTHSDAIIVIVTSLVIPISLMVSQGARIA